jgi:hypothetical protein
MEKNGFISSLFIQALGTVVQTCKKTGGLQWELEPGVFGIS